MLIGNFWLNHFATKQLQKAYQMVYDEHHIV